MFFTKRCPSGGTEYVSFELLLGILRGPGEGRGGTPGTVPLQNPEVTSRKACLRNAENRFRLLAFLASVDMTGPHGWYDSLRSSICCFGFSGFQAQNLAAR